MSSQDTPSADVLSLISYVTEADEVSGDVNAYFQKVTSPETGKTVYKCSFCEKCWETVHKLITIQQDSALQLQSYYDYKPELAKWTHEGELIKLDKDIQKSRDA